MAKPNTFQICWTIHFEETLNTEKPFTQQSFSKNNLRVERNTFPNVREGDNNDYNDSIDYNNCNEYNY